MRGGAGAAGPGLRRHATSARPSARSSPAASAIRRFIGGHPLAGAETAGVAHARADLFDGATWYLTPTAGTAGHAATSACTGSRRRPRRAPRARIDPDDARPPDGRRLPPAARARQRARRPGRGACSPRTASACRRLGRASATPRAWPAPTPAIWRDIYRRQRATRWPSGDRRRDRRACAPSATRWRAADGDAIAAWNDARRARTAAALLEAAPGRRRGARAARRGAQPPGRRRRDRARARPRGGQHRRHGALPGPGHAPRATVALWIAGAARAPAAPSELLGRARPAGGARVRRPLRRPAPRLRGTRAARRRQVDLAPRGAARRDGAEPVRVTQLPATPRTRTRRCAAVARARRAASIEEADEVVDPRPGLRDARRRSTVPIDVGNAGTLMRLLPGWLAGPAGGGSWTLDGDASIRRRPVDRIAEPLRRMGAAIEATRRPLPAVHRPRRAAARRSTTSCRSPPRRSSRACCSPGSSPTGATTVARAAGRAATTPSGCSPRAGVRACAATADRVDGRRRRRARARRRRTCPATRRRRRS